jgi:isopentenyl-diphosphate delta-isomerase type 1
MSNIAFVNEDDEVIGAGTKQEALDGKYIHRIVRIFLYNSGGELLIQRRADHLQSNPGLWDHAAAGHVDEGEEWDIAAHRELREELGVDVPLTYIRKEYFEESDNRGVLKRFNVLYSGTYDGTVSFDENEVAEVRWIAPERLAAWMRETPQQFPEGFCYTFGLIHQ